MSKVYDKVGKICKREVIALTKQELQKSCEHFLGVSVEGRKIIDVLREIQRMGAYVPWGYLEDHKQDWNWQDKF